LLLSPAACGLIVERVKKASPHPNFRLMSRSDLYIGLDVGGSKTELLVRRVASEAVHEAGHFQGPGANPKREGSEKTASVLAGLIRKALQRHPHSNLRALCAGIAGAADRKEQQKLARRLRAALGSRAAEAHLEFRGDAHIALETAFAGESGLVIGAGTGSVVLGRTQEGRVVRAGGWGYAFGDEGSGYALGRAALQAVAAAHDGGPSSRLRPLLAERHGLATREEIVHHVYEAGRPLQDLAPTVLHAADTGDAVATRLLEQQTSLLAQQASWLAARHPSIVSNLSLFGGLASAPTYVEALKKALHDVLPEWSVATASRAPVNGALQLALRAHGPTPVCV
jgi:N-acetylglucosamine kinase-like BadF-type ATPase